MNETKQVRRINVLSVFFDNVTLADMKQNIIYFFKNKHNTIYLSLQPILKS